MRWIWRALTVVLPPLHVLGYIVASWRGSIVVRSRSGDGAPPIEDAGPFMQSRKPSGGGRVSVEPRSVDSAARLGSGIGFAIAILMAALAIVVRDEPAWNVPLYAALLALTVVFAVPSALTLLGRRLVLRR